MAVDFVVWVISDKNLETDCSKTMARGQKTLLFVLFSVFWYTRPETIQTRQRGPEPSPRQDLDFFIEGDP